MKKAFIESKKHLFPPTYHDEVPSHLLTKLIDINNNHHIFFPVYLFFFWCTSTNICCMYKLSDVRLSCVSLGERQDKRYKCSSGA